MVYYCDVCGNPFQHSKTLNRHIKTKHQANTIFMCDKCPKQYDRKDTYMRHLKSCSNKEKETDQCDICFKKFSTSAYVKIHKAKMHKTDNSLPFLWMLDGKKINANPLSKNIKFENFEDGIKQHVVFDKVKIIGDIVEDVLGVVCSIVSKVLLQMSKI